MIDYVYDGLVSWFENIIMSVFDLVSMQFLDFFSLDLTNYFSYFPIVKSAFSIFVYVGMGFAIALLAGTSFASYAGEMYDGYEEASYRIARFVIAMFLVYFSANIVNIILDTMSMPYNDLKSMKIEENVAMFQGVGNNIKSGLEITTLAKVNPVVLTIVTLFCICLIFKNYLNTLLCAAEHYMCLGLLAVTSPLGLSMTASKATKNTAKAWFQMVISTVLLICFDVLFIRGANSAFAAFAVKGATTDSGDGFILLWVIAIIAFLKVGSNIDFQLKNMGLSAPQTGGRLLNSMIIDGYGISRIGKGVAQSFTGGSGVFGKAASVAAGAATGGAATAAGAAAGGLGSAMQFDKNLKKANANIANGVPLSKDVASTIMNNPAASTVKGNLAKGAVDAFYPSLSSKGSKITDANISGGRNGNQSMVTMKNPDGSVSKAMISPTQSKGSVPITSADGQTHYLSNVGNVPIGGLGVKEGEQMSLVDGVNGMEGMFSSSQAQALGFDNPEDLSLTNEGNGILGVYNDDGEQVGAVFAQNADTNMNVGNSITDEFGNDWTGIKTSGMMDSLSSDVVGDDTYLSDGVTGSSYNAGELYDSLNYAINEGTLGSGSVSSEDSIIGMSVSDGKVTASLSNGSMVQTSVADMGISELASVEGMSESKSLQDVVPDYQAVTGKSPMSWSNEHGYIRVVNTDNSTTRLYDAAYNSASGPSHSYGVLNTTDGGAAYAVNGIETKENGFKSRANIHSRNIQDSHTTI